MKHKMAPVLSHEFMHALGFDHEQKRGDQAQNVYIHYGWFQNYLLEQNLIYFLLEFRLKPTVREYFSRTSLCFRSYASQ